jgi:hypothetical protein
MLQGKYFYIGKGMEPFVQFQPIVSLVVSEIQKLFFFEVTANFKAD